MNEIEFLKAVVAYIEQWEYERDGEWGSNRTLEELKAQGAMPPLYAEAKRRLEALQAKGADHEST